MKSPKIMWSVGLTGVAIIVVAALKFTILPGYPLWLLWLGVINLVTACVFVADKKIAVRVADRPPAERGRARIPEFALLWLSLIGGTVGALVAMLGRRHKTMDREFLLRYGLIVVLHALAVGFGVAYVMFGRGSA